MSQTSDTDRLKWYIENHAQWTPYHASAWAGGILSWGTDLNERQCLEERSPTLAIDKAMRLSSIECRHLRRTAPEHPQHNLRAYSNDKCVEYHDYNAWVAAHQDQLHLINPERAYLAGRHDERVGQSILRGPVVSVNPPDQQLWIDYTNWQDQRSIRRVAPQLLFWGQTQWHPKPQWIMRMKDMEKDELRDFALADIHQISTEAFMIK